MAERILACRVRQHTEDREINGNYLPAADTAAMVASGAPLLVDVEFGRGRTLYALSQGFFMPGNPDGAPAEANTGALVEANGDGTFTTLFEPLDRPTSREVIGNTAYVVTIAGEIWKIDNVSAPPSADPVDPVGVCRHSLA